MSMYHVSKHSIPGQVNSVDADGILRLFTDSVAAYVENHATSDARLLHDGGHGAGGLVADVKLDCTSKVSEVISEPIPLPEPAYIKACTELVRIAIALHLGLLIRLWLILNQLSRQTNRKGFTRRQIENGLRAYNVKYSGRNLSRWLRIGLADGLFWTYDTKARLYYPRGYNNLSQLLVGLCESRGLHKLYITNFPGQRRPMLLNVASDNLFQFESSAFAAWVASRENLIIANISLTKLWGRTIPAIRAWIIQGKVTSMKNYTFCDEEHHAAIPRSEDGTWRPDVRRTTLNGRDVIAWQLPNSLSAQVKQYAKKGQLRRTYVLMKRYVKVMKSAGVCEQGDTIPGGSKHTTKTYHQTLKGARDSKAHNGVRSRHAFIGRWGNRYGYFQYTPDGVDRFEFWQVRRLFRRVQCVCFAKR